jgi:hypothetical protein
MEAAATLFWYLVVAAPQGGLVVMPNGFYTREECEVALAQYNTKPAPAGWTLSCVPDSAGYDEGADTAEQPAAPAQ